MADRWALVIAVEKYLQPQIEPVPFAESGAKALAEALASAGYPKAKQFVLLGPHATKAAVESRLGKFRRSIRGGGEVLVVVAGRCRAGRLLCWDALPDDLRATSVSLRDLVAGLERTKADRLAFLLDLSSDGETDLAGLFVGSAKSVSLASCRDGDRPPAATELKATLWAHLAAGALAGRAPKATDGSGRVTAMSLQRYLLAEIPRLARKHFDEPPRTEPVLFGEHNATFALTGTRADSSTPLLDPVRLRRVVFRSESAGRVKDLSGFRKNFSVPTTAGPAHRRFVARTAAADIRADVDAVFEAAREHLGYRRKDIHASVGTDGSGAVRAPDFEYTVSATLDLSDPSRVKWRREVGRFSDQGFVRSAGFAAVFGRLFDQLAFEPDTPVDVAAFVDRLEDAPPRGAAIRVSGDGTECEVSLAGFAGRVTVTRSELVIRGRAGDPGGLLEQFLRFIRTVGPLGELRALPG